MFEFWGIKKNSVNGETDIDLMISFYVIVVSLLNPHIFFPLFFLFVMYIYERNQGRLQFIFNARKLRLLQVLQQDTPHYP